MEREKKGVLSISLLLITFFSLQKFEFILLEN